MNYILEICKWKLSGLFKWQIQSKSILVLHGMVPASRYQREENTQKADINLTLVLADGLALFTTNHPDDEPTGKAATESRGQTALDRFSVCFYDLQV